MEEENKIETPEEASVKARRKFLKTAASVAVTAPAVTMLLAAQSKAGTAGWPQGECKFGLYGEVLNGPQDDQKTGCFTPM
jgi:hypothetical protein